jgi:hypothetical protein
MRLLRGRLATHSVMATPIYRGEAISQLFLRLWSRSVSRVTKREGKQLGPMIFHQENLDFPLGKGRLELPRLAAHDPKSCPSASSGTSP